MELSLLLQVFGNIKHIFDLRMEVKVNGIKNEGKVNLCTKDHPFNN